MLMYSHALGERADSMIAIVGAKAKMQAKMYQAFRAVVMHPPKDKRCPLEYRFQCCRVQTTILSQNDSVGYRSASLLTVINEVI